MESNIVSKLEEKLNQVYTDMFKLDGKKEELQYKIRSLEKRMTDDSIQTKYKGKCYRYNRDWYFRIIGFTRKGCVPIVMKVKMSDKTPKIFVENIYLDKLLKMNQIYEIDYNIFEKALKHTEWIIEMADNRANSYAI